MRFRHCTLLFFAVCLFLRHTHAWHSCEDGGICPDGNRCCESSYCLSGQNASTGMCCGANRGCREGYVCEGNSCRKLNTTVDKSLPDSIPQYKLCKVSKESLQVIQRLRSGESSAAYLSTLGPIDPVAHAEIETVFIVVHGSERNADDYICCASASIPEKTLVVAPWFLARQDRYAKNSDLLVWSDNGPIEHTWRYGADAENSNVSSYAVMDGLVKLAEQLPKLKRVVVAGHSAGGQYVQRWALLTDYFPAHLRAVVANPKSFCWLDGNRVFNGTFRLPQDDAISICDTYNKWEWGLENSTEIIAPYKDRIIEKVGKEAIMLRYPGRDVVYLAGELDTEHNGDCEDRMQGAFRRIRSENFYASLRHIYGRQIHHRFVVTGVFHDHCLMFQSPEGQRALFETERYSSIAG